MTANFVPPYVVKPRYLRSVRRECEPFPLRAAYAKALTRSELAVETKKQNLEGDLIHGDEMKALAKEVMNQPAEVIGLSKKMMGE